MIILKHLTVERFRLLREVNLHFPQRGSILIQGPNEAGKSALLECIYFALYGESPASDRGKRSLDDFILYGATNATVTLTLSIATTELQVSRIIERGSGQRATLTISNLDDSSEETVSGLGSVNERILAELGRLDGEALRNSSLIEQKALGRLETLPGRQREATVRKLLGLEKLTRLASQFQVGPEDDRQLEEGQERLRLAEIQEQIPATGKQLETVEAALDAVTLCEYLDGIAAQETEITNQEQALAEMKRRQQNLKNQQVRVQHLKRADGTLAEIISAYDEIADARKALPELEKQIGELERREREELPDLEHRVTELSELRRSFGTLEHMSNDLLGVVDTIKDLEQELKRYDEAREDLQKMDDQVDYARKRFQQAQKAVTDLDAERNAKRPQHEARLQRLRTLSARLQDLSAAEEQYLRLLNSQNLMGERLERMQKLQKDLQETEHELSQVEAEAKKTQQQAEMTEQRWRDVAMRRQVEEWQRLKGLAQGLAQAELHVQMARQQQERLTHITIEARNSVRNYTMFFAISTLFAIICLIVAIAELSTFIISLLVGIIFIALCGASYYCYQNLRKYRSLAQETMLQEQEAISKVGMMVAARESAIRVGGTSEDIARVEHEIRTLGGNVPRSVEEARQVLQQLQDNGENLTELQQEMRKRQEEANIARSQHNVTLEALALLRKERGRMEHLREVEQWDTLDERLQQEQMMLGLLQQEITLLAGQEGLPTPSINKRLHKSGALTAYTSQPLSGDLDEDLDDAVGIPDLDEMVQSTIKVAEHELAVLDGNPDVKNDLVAQAKIHQDALDVLLTRKKAQEERVARIAAKNPMQQMERVREQQAELRRALQSLQDSLRQRVKPLGITFLQTAINSAETTARKQLEELHITLGSKMILQEKHNGYVARLRARQEDLAELYKQLARYSNTLGGWIVPPKPFPEALAALRTRCQKEINDANESQMVRDLEDLQHRQTEAQEQIVHCQKEIEQLRQRIASMLKQRNRPKPKNFVRSDIVSVWPLVGEHTSQDRTTLEEQRAAIEQKLAELEQRELELGTALKVGNITLNVEQTQKTLQQLRDSYEIRKRGGAMIKTVNERLMRKMVPRIEYYMQQILPQLTSGRYHDVHLVTDIEEQSISGGPFKINVWESAAGEYIPKSALSGGAGDLLSLALRLAFTIAALPREPQRVPGFAILDEPLSSFDKGRAQALATVVTGELLSKHFEQIILISHSSAFDPSLFPYHVYMDNGAVVESNLPVVPVALPVENEEVQPEPHTEESKAVAVVDIDDLDEEDPSGATQARLPVIRIQR